jgi:hypothetical protein
LKKRIIVSVILVLGVLLLFTGSVFPFASMGSYNSSCDSCHGVGKSAKPLPEQQQAPAPTAPTAPTAPKTTTTVSTSTVDFTIFNRSGKATVVTQGGVTYVSVKSLADLYKVFAAYDDVSMKFTLKTQDFDLSGTVNKKEAVLNGKAVSFDNVVRNINSRVYVDIKSLGKLLGGEVTVTTSRITVLVSMTELQRLTAISEEWKTSGKQFGITSTFGRGISCGKCHDGYGFAEQEKYAANPASFEPVHMSGIDCQSCHTGFGQKLMEAGEVAVLFSSEPIKAGTGALCIGCHNSNRDPVQTYKDLTAGTLTRLSYPHYGMQGALWSGIGGMEIPGVTYASTTAHVNIKDSCVACHMPTTKGDYKQHTFGMDLDYISQQCGTCHTSATNYNYRGLQTEIKGMLDKVYAAILADTGADKVTMSGGAFHFHKGDATLAVKDISPSAYVAVYNWRMVKYDASYGVHNPAYAKQLLRESYKLLTGKTL